MGLDTEKMKNTAQDAKGRLKEATGAATGDEKLKAEGWQDQAAAAVKDGAEKVKKAVGDATRQVKDKAEHLFKK